MLFLFLKDKQKQYFSNDEVAKIKEYLLTTNLIKKYDRTKLRAYLHNINDTNIMYDYVYLDYGKRLKQFNIYEYSLKALQSDYNAKVFNVADSLLRGRYEKVKRIKERLSSYIMTSRAYFLTLTFTDEVLASTNEQTRRRYVSRYLKALSNDYVANIDFGSQNNREHYHAIIIDYNDTIKWRYGFIKVMKVGKQESSPVKLSKYITKLSYHAVKESTRYGLTFRRLIYSRIN